MKNTLTINANDSCSCDCLDYVNDGSNSIYLIVIVGNVTSPKLTLDGVTKALEANTSNIVEISTAKFVANATITFNYSDETHTGNTFKITFPNKLEGNLTIKRVDTFNYNAKYTKIGSDGSTTVTVKVNSTTTGAPGTDAQVTNSGTDENVRLNFIIPRGDKGDQGPLGPQGLQGEQGPGGPIGPPGDRGEKGDPGDTGETGPQGPKGDTGETGPSGANGKDGTNGKDGAAGAKGDTGLTALEMKTSMGSEYTTPGQTVQVLNSYFNRPPVVGDNFIANDTAGNLGHWEVVSISGSYTACKLYSYTAIKGDKGDKGDKGEKGDKGDAGTTLTCKKTLDAVYTTLNTFIKLNFSDFNRTPGFEYVTLIDANSNIGVWKITEIYQDTSQVGLRLQSVASHSFDSTLSDSSTNAVQNKVITARLNEVFQSVSDGKSLVASAITDKGVATASDATFQTMATNISNIPSGADVVFNEYISATTIDIKKDTYQGKTLKQIIIMYCSYYLKTNYGTGTARATLTANTDASEYMTQLFVKNCGSARPSSTGNMNIPSFTAYEIADETPLDTLLCTVTLTSTKVRTSSSGTTTIKSHAYIYKIYE